MYYACYVVALIDWCRHPVRFVVLRVAARHYDLDHYLVILGNRHGTLDLLHSRSFVDDQLLHAAVYDSVGCEERLYKDVEPLDLHLKYEQAAIAIAAGPFAGVSLGVCLIGRGAWKERFSAERGVRGAATRGCSNQWEIKLSRPFSSPWDARPLYPFASCSLPSRTRFLRRTQDSCTMTMASHSEFGAKTDAKAVFAAFPTAVEGKVSML
jgi:hypothetical protein